MRTECLHKRTGSTEIGAYIKPYCMDCSLTLIEIDLEKDLKSERENREVFCFAERERFKKLRNEVVELREFRDAMMKKIYFDVEEHNVNNESHITPEDIIKCWMEIDG